MPYLFLVRGLNPQSPGLFAVPTRIVVIVAPINAFINYLLGEHIRPRIAHFPPLTPRSVGPSPYSPRIHRCTHCHCVLIQSYRPALRAVRCLLHAAHGVVPALAAHVHEPRRPRQPWAERRRADRVGMVGLGARCARSVAVRVFPADAFYRIVLMGLRILISIDRLGPTALATQSVLLVSSSTTYQAPFALSVAAAVRCGFSDHMLRWPV